MKKERQKKIREIVETHKINTQDELIKKLQEAGFTATQATMSRDIRELKLTKITDGENGYFYAFHSNPAVNDINRLNHSLTHLIESVNSANNIIVIKTMVGMAQAVATGIDAIKSDDILGCVAGDDTLFVVVKDNKSAEEIGSKIQIMMTES